MELVAGDDQAARLLGVDQVSQEARLAMHRPAVAQVFAEVGVEKGQRDGEPLQWSNRIEQQRTQYCDTEAHDHRRGEMQWPGIVLRNMQFAKRGSGLMYAL